MIQWNKDTLEQKSTIAQIMPIAETEWQARAKLYERIRRKTNNSELASSSDEHIKVPFEYFINSMVTGYFAGKAPVYDVEINAKDDKTNIIKKMFDKLTGQYE